MVVLCDGSPLGLLRGERVVGGKPGYGETRETHVDERGWCA